MNENNILNKSNMTPTISESSNTIDSTSNSLLKMVEAQVVTADGRVITISVPESTVAAGAMAYSYTKRLTKPPVFYTTLNQVKQNMHDISDDDLQAFFGYIPETFTQDMVCCLAVLLLSKILIGSSQLTYSETQDIITKNPSEFETEEDKNLAYAYKTCYTNFKNSSIENFEWNTEMTEHVSETQSVSEEDPLTEKKQFKEKLVRNMEMKSAYNSRDEKNKLISVSLSPDLFTMLQIAKCSYKNNLTSYVAGLIQDDILKHYDVYEEIFTEVSSDKLNNRMSKLGVFENSGDSDLSEEEMKKMLHEIIEDAIASLKKSE